MKKSNVEIAVLVVGITIIGIALFMMFSGGTDPSRIFYTNIIFAVGFLVYILYSMLSTQNLNREIKNLNEQVTSLNGDIVERDGTIAGLQGELATLKDEKAALETEVESLTAQVSALEEERDSVQKQLAELKTQKEQAEGNM